MKIFVIYFLASILFIVPNQTPSAYPNYIETSQPSAFPDKTVEPNLETMSLLSSDRMMNERNKRKILEPDILTLAQTDDILLMHSDSGAVNDVESMLFNDHGITSRQMDISGTVPELQELEVFPLIFV
jgi:hypothetical protein